MSDAFTPERLTPADSAQSGFPMQEEQQPLPIRSMPENFTASDGVRLAIHRFHPEDGPVRGTIVSLHGIQSHAGWYHRSSTQLAQAGWDVWFLDRRGSGISGGDRGHAEHWERLVNDVVAVLRQIRSRKSPGPVILQAVSWGGKLAAAVARVHAELVDGLALLYPGIHARIRPGLRQRLLLKLADFARIRRRRVLIPLDDAALFTSDPARQQFLREDPLSIRVATSGFLNADRHLTHLAQTAGPELRCPILLMLAGRDRIIDNGAMKRFFATIASPSRTLIEFPEAAHTLEFEPCFDHFVQQYFTWLNAISPNRGDTA
ncbi:lysophospholipase L2 [Caulifigura coniformis]|uniref:Lysophospholipase L2 n=1 Tax=Caulifigura coniformis TaxID=2527983 RepID=A0A517SJR1_9PLAN|nr:alpha/beta fold hydrolase [Caulifigura coniformis]QDT56355.1 lysophospholipase L2 [Caulifigura coniformis]